jgi:hypothetical protein
MPALDDARLLKPSPYGTGRFSLLHLEKRLALSGSGRFVEFHRNYYNGCSHNKGENNNENVNDYDELYNIYPHLFPDAAYNFIHQTFSFLNGKIPVQRLFNSQEKSLFHRRKFSGGGRNV